MSLARKALFCAADFIVYMSFLLERGAAKIMEKIFGDSFVEFECPKCKKINKVRWEAHVQCLVCGQCKSHFEVGRDLIVVKND